MEWVMAMTTLKKYAARAVLIAATAGLTGCYVGPAYGPRAVVYGPAYAPAYGYYHGGYYGYGGGYYRHY
jgi:hypothetical protein